MNSYKRFSRLRIINVPLRSLLIQFAVVAFAVVAYITIAASPARAQSADPALQATGAKLEAYVELMNRTLRGVSALSRYDSWVDMDKGPTGKERHIYGIYSLHNAGKSIEDAKAVVGKEPVFAELDAVIPAYIAAYEKLAPTIEKANKYYERKDYRDDKMAEGKEYHALLVADGKAFLDLRKQADALLDAEKGKYDVAYLADIETRVGRKADWQVANVMLHAKNLMDSFDGEKGSVDMGPFEERVKTYAAAVREMDDYGSANPDSFHTFESMPAQFLGKVRDLRDGLEASKGKINNKTANAMNRLVSDYNMMVTMSQSATRFAK